jgi:hypothetical protein
MGDVQYSIGDTASGRFRRSARRGSSRRPLPLASLKTLNGQCKRMTPLSMHQTSLWLTSGGLELPPGQLYMTFNETVDPKFVKESGNLLHR